ncbi:hypothetical protein FA13DRAFT_1631529, partial [Coprinellus micaceus]
MATPAPGTFDVARRSLNTTLVESLGDVTQDLTEDQLFTTPFTLAEVEAAKKRIRNRDGSAAGADGITYKEVLLMDNDIVLGLCNACVERKDAPTSCVVKFMTQLLTARLAKFAESKGLLPPSQNGFREGYQTCNNMFILQGAIHRAKANGKPLYLGYIDMTNAFPSTDHATLWWKLHRMGAGGPMFD